MLAAVPNQQAFPSSLALSTPISTATASAPASPPQNLGPVVPQVEAGEAAAAEGVGKIVADRRGGGSGALTFELRGVPSGFLLEDSSTGSSALGDILTRLFSLLVFLPVLYFLPPTLNVESHLEHQTLNRYLTSPLLIQTSELGRHLVQEAHVHKLRHSSKKVDKLQLLKEERGRRFSWKPREVYEEVEGVTDVAAKLGGLPLLVRGGGPGHGGHGGRGPGYDCLGQSKTHFLPNFPLGSHSRGST
ncbi:hypothetical protein BT69DRAFT_1304373 [Atractiella rhizophila]|nr:hypothetical protein BT69DRAFT_1304373 [Atractiella rhizophila]